jgi:D-alanyl-lipoteichoic acid acyltransferase DltB (MBOAT superfamily)
LGFRFNINFNNPYKAVSVTDFWRRCHISLSSWLKDYLYISLGGNRKGRVSQYLNL